MKVVGGDLHAKQQTIATVDTDTGELLERTLVQESNAVARVLRCLRGADGGRHPSHRIDEAEYTNMARTNIVTTCASGRTPRGKLAFIFSAWHVPMSVALSSL